MPEDDMDVHLKIKTSSFISRLIVIESVFLTLILIKGSTKK